MKRAANLASSLLITVLLLAGSSMSQNNGQNVRAVVPFDFLVGNVNLPAGQYEFVRTGANTLLVRNAAGRGLVTVVIGTTEASHAPSTSNLKFATIGNTHVLIQVWSEQDRIGNELFHAHALAEAAHNPALHGLNAGRR